MSSNTSAETPEEGRHTRQIGSEDPHQRMYRKIYEEAAAHGIHNPALCTMLTAMFEKENAELKKEVEWLKQRDKDTGEMILPIIGYFQEEGGGDKYGLKPGQSIFKKVLEIVKDDKSAETIKRYKALIEEHIELDGWIYQKTFEHDMPGATPLHDWIIRAKSALSGTNE